MKYDHDTHHRRSVRLKNYDYSTAGAYFVTICTENKGNALGEINDGEMRLNEFGEIVEECWHLINDHFPNVITDYYAIMPNHFHGVIVTNDPTLRDVVGVGFPDPSSKGAVTAPLRRDNKWLSKKPTLGQIVGYFKYVSSKRINKLRKTPGLKLWQRNYYEHVVRSEEDLNAIRQYIIDNPANWEDDEYYV